MRLLDHGRFIFGFLPWQFREDWRWGVNNGTIAYWYDLGPFYIGWRHPRWDGRDIGWAEVEREIG